MSFLILHLLKSTLIISVLYTGYELFLRREAYFRFNRFYLLLSVFLALFLPFFSFPASQLISYTPVLPDMNMNTQLTVFTLEEVVIRAGSRSGSFLGDYQMGMLLIIYFSGVVFLISRFLFRLIRIAVLIRKSVRLKKYGVTFVLVPDSPTHSFLTWIFIDPELLKSDDLQKIIAHEQVHIAQRHTFDLLLTELLIIFQWFNPLVYLLRNRIKDNHEYLADRSMISGNSGFASYHSLLIQHSGIIPTDILTHNFSYSLLKRRLHMMKKPKRPLRFGLGVLLITALFAVVFFACSSPDKENIEADKVFTEVEVYPEFPGGMEGLMSYLSTNIHYPENAKNQGVEGRVFINFIIEKDGSVDSAKVLRGIGGGCDEEALRVVSEMPDWTPGYQHGEAVRVSYNLPVKFSLDKSEHKLTHTYVIDDTDSVYTLVDVMPEFPGGVNALMSYLSEHITYPEQAKKEGVHGRVFISFVIEKTGKVNNVNVLRGIGEACDEEAVRVISDMPAWKPGLQDGEPVRVSYNIPIKFALN